MKKLFLDTNIIIRLLRGEVEIADKIAAFDRIMISTVVLGEFKAGVDLGTSAGRAQKSALDELLDSDSVEIAPITEDISDEYARIFRVLKEKGTPIPLNDIWIAAQTMECGAWLYTGDSHFSSIPLIKLL